MENYKVYRLFIASPGDVAEERRRLLAGVREVNEYVKSLNVYLDASDWHSAVPGAERPQGLINEQLLQSCDIFIGILWHHLAGQIKTTTPLEF